MIHVRVCLLGPAKSLVGTEALDLPLRKGATLADAHLALLDQYPELQRLLPSCRLAVNLEYVSADTPLHDKDEVAVIPPVSGGAGDRSIWVDLVDQEIPIGEIQRFVSGDARWGGIVVFEGATRAESDPEHGDLLHLDYEAYREMALRQMMSLAQGAVDRWSMGRVATLHRLGRVQPTEVSVVIAVAGPHRAECFEACRWIIDTLKADVPIWKRDVFADGFARWVDPNKSKEKS